MYNFYKKNYGIDSAEMVINVLKSYGLDTVDGCKDRLPIILECFEEESLAKMQSLGSNLPRIFLTKQIIGELMLVLPRINKVAHGIGPKSSLVFELDHILMTMTKKLKLDVHPWYVRDDQLQFTKTP